MSRKELVRCDTVLLACLCPRAAQRDSVLNLIIAGRDTTAQALSWTYFYIVRDPSLLAPVRSEIEEMLPGGQPVDYDNYRVLVRTTALFMEVLRLHPCAVCVLWGIRGLRDRVQLGTQEYPRRTAR
jgi:cytochrome P450